MRVESGLKDLAFSPVAFFFNTLSSVQSCSSISKREAVRADPTLGLLTYGPIKVDVPEMPQSSELL